jgi:large subunit ribosomal protein L21
MVDYAIVQTGGKQYRVQEGDTVRVESLEGDKGDTVEISSVLGVSLDGSFSLGSPTVHGAKVNAEIVDKGLGKKIVVFKYKAKTRYRRKNGHRQPYADLKITSIKIDK